MSELRILSPGPLTTIQDRGRIGWQRFGVSGSGPMDWIAHRLANRLAGNADGEAAIEFALGGLSFEVQAPSVRLSFTGGGFVDGRFALQIDGRQAPWWSAITLYRGQVVRIGRAEGGVWGYIGVAGGLAMTPQLGSFATHTLSKLGGLAGRRLQAGDRLRLAAPERAVGPDLLLPEPPTLPSPRIRVVLGPQDDYFTAHGIETLLSASWRVSAQADRMGYRLEGPVIAHAKGANIVSDGTVMGSVQVPGAGTPIMLMADRQTTGGYPKIATVVTADLPALAQVPPGGSLRFAAVSYAEALAARRQLTMRLDRLAARFRPFALGAELDSSRLLGLNLISGVTAGDHLPS